MRNFIQTLAISIGLTTTIFTSTYAQNPGMNALRQANSQSRNMVMDHHRAQTRWGGDNLDQPLLGTERVVMPDGHIVEYRHIYHGPVVFDSIPFQRQLQTHLIPFVGVRISDIIAGPNISSSPFKPGANAGFRVDWYKNDEKSIYIATGLHYAFTALSYSSNGNQFLRGHPEFAFTTSNKDIDPYSGEVRIHNFFVPLYVGPQFKLGNGANFGFGFGGQFGAIAYAETKENDNIFHPYNDIFEGNIGGELWYAHKHLFVGFQYSWGFQELDYGYRYGQNIHSTTNRQTFALNIGYRIFQKP